ncbi:hypothetical protein H4S07_004415 [Coemansia furcata]|uniref:Uncharacterized protein n=1 Tax=Coemansia furcata TaxID=417177 RepID=A0ACC1LAC0_9FUNG|nr:hypothetical protein H4S07_004415 [Coemansia furcata]
MASSSRVLATSSMADSILGGTSTSTASNRNRNRSASGATSASRQSVGGDSLATKDVQSMAALKLSGARTRAGSVGQTSEITPSSLSSASAGVNGKTTAAGLASADASSPASPAAHALSVPPANANLAEFLENVIILQESIKEIIARVQVRRENGGDEDAVS